MTIQINDLPLYRVRLSGTSIRRPIIHEFGRKLFSAREYAAEARTLGGYNAAVEAYDRHTGETLRIVG